MLPEIVTVVPGAALLGDILLMTGTAFKLYASEVEAHPLLTKIAPLQLPDMAGATNERDVDELTTLVPGRPKKVTVLPGRKLLPVKVTTLPPPNEGFGLDTVLITGVCGTAYGIPPDGVPHAFVTMIFPEHAVGAGGRIAVILVLL